jgi:hypothetical protein
LWSFADDLRMSLKTTMHDAWPAAHALPRGRWLRCDEPLDKTPIDHE